MMIPVIGLPSTLPRINIGNVDDPVIGDYFSWTICPTSGGTTPFTWSATGLPAGMGVRTGGVSGITTSTGCGEIFGPATATGDFTVALKMTDGNNISTTVNIPLHVSPLNISFPAGGSALPDGTLNVAYPATTVRILGGKAPYTTGTPTVNGKLPAGLSASPTTNVVSGTPAENGTFSPQFLITDSSAATLKRTSSINIQGGTATTFSINSQGTAGFDLGVATLGQPYSRSFSACCLPSYTWTVDANKPAGLTMSAAGVLSGTPTTAGTYTFLVTAADPANVSNAAVRQFRLTVSPMSITTTTLPFANATTAYSQQLTAAGGVGNVTWTLSGVNTYLPPGITLSSAGLLSGTTTSVGQYFFTVLATDSAGTPNTALASFTLNVYAAGQLPPLFLGTSQNLSYQLGRNTLGLFATGGSGTYTYSLTPGANPVPGFRIQNGAPLVYGASATAQLLGVAVQPGVYPTSIRVTDSATPPNTFDRPITVTILPLTILDQFGLPKATLNQAYTGNTSSGYQFAPTGGPSGGAYTFTATTSTLPPGMTLSSTGLLSGTPTSAGIYTINFTLANAAYSAATSSCSTGTNCTPSFSASITVDPFAITTASTLPQGLVGATYTTSAPLATFSAPNCGTNCQWTGSMPFGLTLTSDGKITGSPSSGGQSSVTIQASGSAGTVQKIFKISVTPSVITGLSVSTNYTTSITTGSTISTQLTASGGMAPYTWALASGSTLPPGLSISDINTTGEKLSTNLIPGYYYIYGRATTPGVYNFTVQVTDSSPTPLVATRQLTLVVSELVLDYTSLPLAPAGCGTTICQPIIYNTAIPSPGQPMLVLGGSGNYTSWSPTTIYPGLTMNGTTGVITGTPANTGSQTQLVAVTDSNGKTVLTNVSINAASTSGATITLSSGPNLGTVGLGNINLFNVTPTGGAAPYTVSAVGALPAGVQILNQTAATSGFSTTSNVIQTLLSAPGTYTFTLQAADSSTPANIGYRTYTITVAGNSGIVTTSLPDAFVNTAYSRQLYAFLGSGSAVFAVSPGSALPAGMSISAGGTLSGTPTVAGSYSFSLTVGDGTNNITYGFSLKVSGIRITSPQVLPVATVGVLYGGASGYQLTATGGTGALTWTVTGLPSGLSATPLGVISGTPDSSSARFTVTLSASDGVSTVTSTTSMFVSQQNPSLLDLPTSVTLMTDAIVGQVYSWTASPTGGTAPYSWAVATGSALPPGFSILTTPLSSSAPGILSLAGAPTTAGSYSFNMNISDSAGATIVRTFTLKVGTISLTSGNPRAAIVGSPYAVQFSAAGGTPPYTFAMTAVNLVQDLLPPGLTFASTGLIQGTPSGTGSFSFNLTATDSLGASYTRQMTLNSFSGTSGSVQINSGNIVATAGTNAGNISLAASGFPGAVNWSLAPGSAPLPSGVSISSANQTMQGNFNVPGKFSFTLRATDATSSANFADRLITYEVSSMQQVAPLTNYGGTVALPAAKTGSAYSFTLKVAGGTPPYTFVESPFTPLPPGMTLSSAGVLSGTPSQAGAFAIRPIVTDSTGARLINTTSTLPVTGATGRQNLFNLSSTDPGTPSVGSFYSFPLDRHVLGVPPYNFSVTSGTLPPGLSIIPGSNGVPSQLAGTPTTAGSYPITLTVTDAAQTLNIPTTLTVTPLTLTPAAVSNGIVGTPYSVSFVASGGTAPYQLQLVQPTAATSGSVTVPGLSFSGNSLSGNPTVPGVFPVQLVLTDSSTPQNTLSRTYEITIDNAAGQAPAISVGPKPVNILYIQGAPAPSVPLAVNSTSGNRAFTGAVLGLSAGSLSATSGTTNATPSLNINTAGLAAGTYSGMIGVASSAALYGSDVTPISLTVLAPPPCTYSLTPGSASYSGIASSGTFNINTGNNCAWSASVSSSATWLTTSGSTTGTGSGTVSYNITANTNPAQRTGTITVAGQTFTVTQFGTSCSFAIRPTSLDALATGGTATIDVVASGTTCAWPASSGLGVVTPTNPTGSGQATITIPANTQATGVTLTATIAGQTLTVNQGGAACTPSLNSPGISMPFGGGNGSVAITAAPNCTYSTIVGPSWISVTSGGSGTIPASGSANVTFSISSNSTTSTRSGNLLIGGQAFLVTQDGLACSVTLDTSQLPSPFAAAGGNGTLGISANGPNCAWTAASNNSFATVSPPSGTGTGTVTVTLASNAASPTARTGSLTISGQTVNLAQAGTTCTYALRAVTSNVSAAGGVGSVGVIAPSACSWTATSNSSFLTVVSGASSNGTSEVQFVVSPSTNASPQAGTLTIAGQTFTVNQAGAPCSFTLGSASATLGSPGATGSTVTYTTAQTGCSVTPISYSNWLTFTNSFSGQSGTLTYNAAPNPSASTRTGNIQIGDKVFTVTESGAPCAYSLNGSGASFGKLGGNGNIQGSANAVGCTPTVTTSTPAIIQLPALAGPTNNIFSQDFIVNPFNSVVKSVRRGTINFGNQIFTVKQTSY